MRKVLWRRRLNNPPVMLLRIPIRMQELVPSRASQLRTLQLDSRKRRKRRMALSPGRMIREREPEFPALDFRAAIIRFAIGKPYRHEPIYSGRVHVARVVKKLCKYLREPEEHREVGDGVLGRWRGAFADLPRGGVQQDSIVADAVFEARDAV